MCIYPAPILSSYCLLLRIDGAPCVSSQLSLSLSTSFLTSLVFAVVLSPCLVSSPEVLITQANAVKLRHCPAVIRWRSNKASHSIIVILIWCKSNMLSLPVIPADTQLCRGRALLDPKKFVYLTSFTVTGECLNGLFSSQHQAGSIIGVVMCSFSPHLFT